jgi:hypothetical protein
VIPPQQTSFWQNCKGLAILWHILGGNYSFYEYTIHAQGAERAQSV